MRREAVLLLLGLLACGRGGDLLIDPPGPEYRIVFEPPFQNEVLATIGTTGQLRASVVDKRGKSIGPDEGPTFHSTNPAAVAVDATGRFTVLSPHGATIIAAARVRSIQVTGGVTVSVVCTLELRMGMSPTAVTLEVGERFTAAMTLSSCGGHVSLSDTITWSASDPTVLSVNPATGETMAIKSGSASVQGRASSYGVTGSIPVTVR